MIKGCLIGRDVHASYSKKIHQALGSSYDLISLKEDELDAFFSHNDYDFINVTMPYKKDVVKYLDKASHEVDVLGVCNLIKRENGKYVGYNTDYLGFLDALEYANIDYKKKNFLILGSGGAAKAIGYALCVNGCFGDVASRSKDGYIKYHELNMDDYDIVINATPNGMYPNICNSSLVKLSEKNKVIIDIIYNPYRTSLLLDGEKQGKTIMNGIPMLVFQACHAYDNYNREDAVALIKLLEEERNIVIIGMPYAGKSELGKKLYEQYPERDLYDIDEIIESRYGKISDIFKKHGEEYFRNLEEEVIKEVALKQNAIIVPGGGFFKHNINVLRLKTNGMFIYLNTDIKKIKDNYLNNTHNDRPLIKDISDLDKLYQERCDIYLKMADKVYIGEDYDNYTK